MLCKLMRGYLISQKALPSFNHIHSWGGGGAQLGCDAKITIIICQSVLHYTLIRLVRCDVKGMGRRGLSFMSL